LFEIELGLKTNLLLASSNLGSVYNERLAIVLGLLTLTSGLVVFLSCRTCLSWLSHLGLKNLTQTRGYSVFFRYHLYYWWTFGVLLVAHLMVAVLHTGLPQAGDPDANVHWTILGLGLFSAISGLVVFSSCRVLPRLLGMALPRKRLNNLALSPFFKYHSFLWLILAALAISHFLVGLNHSGIWPGG
jgi:cytochrome b561